MKTIQKEIIQAFDKYTNNIAIQKGSLTVTYEFLERKVKILSCYLQELDISEKTYIAVMFDDTINYIISIIAILNIRCVFVPLDNRLSNDSIERMIINSGIKYIICDDSLKACGDLIDNVIKYNWQAELKLKGTDTMFLKKYELDDPIYIYYTSGSMGNPKGVIGKNESLVHFLKWEINEFSLKEGYKYAQITSPSFDPFLREIFVPILSGGKICLFESNDKVKNIYFLSTWLNDNKISVLHCVPSVFHMCVRMIEIRKYKLENMKYIFLAGEQPSVEVLALWMKFNLSHIKIVNFYGTTETTLVKMFHIINNNDIKKGIVPIGIELPSVKVYILDENNRETNYGEICIETRYCSLGYIDKTQNLNKFVDSPFNKKLKLYKTGDLGKLLDNNKLLFCGRKDRQIKISGISVNLENMEKDILLNTEIESCCLMLNICKNRLFCYYVSRKEVDVDTINEKLRIIYQDVVLPKRYIRVKELIRNLNGKIDKNYYSNICNNSISGDS